MPGSCNVVFPRAHGAARRLRAFALSASVGLIACELDSPAGGGPVINEPAVLEVLGGKDQTAKVGTKLPAAIIVKVSDSRKEAVLGVTVTFEVIVGEGSLTSTSVKTAADGTAQVDWTLGPDTGGQQIEARVVDPRSNQVVLSARINAVATP
jgi:hypothetical protein